MIGSRVTRSNQPNLSISSHPGPGPTTVHDQSFKDFLAFKRRTVAPMLIVSLGYFLGVMLLAGYARSFMAEKLFGAFNVGYLLVLGIYVVCWGVAILYYFVATFHVDPQANQLRADRDARSHVPEANP